MHELPIRPRRNRRSEAIRSLVRETDLRPHHLIQPLFVQEGNRRRSPISSLPGQFRWSVDLAIREAREIYKLGIPAIALFPVVPDRLKDKFAVESKNPQGLLQHAVRAIKDAVPELAVITDVAMDPYSSDGHDGVFEKGRILNDETLVILGEMALSQAAAGADIVAPSDMMDGRVGYIRRVLDQNGYSEVGILAYSAKYASSFYGPFRDALSSQPKKGDKKSYQMDPANLKEALREVQLDIQEGADMVMVKPAHTYLDVIRYISEHVQVPVAAYHVSGELAMLHAAARMKMLDLDRALLEVLVSIRRAGAQMILTYAAKDVVKRLLV